MRVPFVLPQPIKAPRRSRLSGVPGPVVCRGQCGWRLVHDVEFRRSIDGPVVQRGQAWAAAVHLGAVVEVEGLAHLRFSVGLATLLASLFKMVLELVTVPGRLFVGVRGGVAAPGHHRRGRGRGAGRGQRWQTGRIVIGRRNGVTVHRPDTLTIDGSYQHHAPLGAALLLGEHNSVVLRSTVPTGSGLTIITWS